MNLFVANWKMNKTRGEARAFAEALSSRLGDSPPEAELVVAPPFTSLDAASDSRKPARWSLAGQDIGAEKEGAFTGEVSGGMLRDLGCKYVLVGHSERRRIFHEDGSLLERKLARARDAGIVPIYCLGETEDERRAGQTAATFVRQVETLSGDSPELPLVVAYEPVWAIGTGVAATPGDAAAARAHLRELLASRRGLRILYGGSVTPDNARSILEVSGMDGFLIGGASLDPASFLRVAGLT